MRAQDQAKKKRQFAELFAGRILASLATRPQPSRTHSTEGEHMKQVSRAAEVL